MKRTAVFGGTFAPMHKGHLSICENILNEFNLDGVVVMPNFLPPHKDGGMDAADRLELCRIMTKGIKGVSVSDYEIKKGGISYTYETLAAFKNGDTELYFVLGGDSVRELHLWRKPESIAASATLIAVPRPYIESGAEIAALEKKYGIKILRSAFTPPQISSTQVRLAASFGYDISPLTSAAAAEYIKENKLCGGYAGIYNYLRPLLSDKRLLHTYHTAVTAHELAVINGADTGKAVTAALLHDCAKEKRPDTEIPADILRMPEKVRHGPIGALMAEKDLGITDPDILNAIKYHTTGRENMTLLEKIIFVADYIDPSRDYEDTPRCYEAAMRGLDTGARLKREELARLYG